MTLNKTDHLAFRNHLAIDADALAKIFQMRRCVKPHLVSGFLQNGSRNVRHRALAVGSRHMHGPEFQVRMSEITVKRQSVRQTRLIGIRANILIKWQLRKQKIESLLVGHLERKR